MSVMTFEEFRAELSGGKLEFDTPITIAEFKTVGRPPLHVRHVLNGATLTYTGGRGKGPALQIGVDGHCKFERSSFRDLHLACPYGADEGIRIDSADLSRFENISVQSPSMDVGINVRNGFSNSINGIYCNGAAVGLQVGYDHDDKVNTFSVRDGRIVNASIGVLMSCTTFDINTLDCSVCKQHAVWLIGTQYGRVHLYTEQIGGTEDSSVVRLNRCESIEVAGMLNCGNKGDNAHYCVDLHDCHDIFVTGRGNKPLVDFVRHGNDSTNVQISGTCEQ